MGEKKKQGEKVAELDRILGQLKALRLEEQDCIVNEAQTDLGIRREARQRKEAAKRVVREREQTEEAAMQRRFGEHLKTAKESARDLAAALKRASCEYKWVAEEV